MWEPFDDISDWGFFCFLNEERINENEVKRTLDLDNEFYCPAPGENVDEDDDFMI